jgi:hypothetical protein
MAEYKVKVLFVYFNVLWHADVLIGKILMILIVTSMRAHENGGAIFK